MKLVRSTIPQTVLDSLDIGETIRINHDDCAAGVDTRSRLYLTRPVSRPDTVLAYCHNCQSGSSINVGSAFRDWHKGSKKNAYNVTLPIVNEFSEPSTLISDPKMWPPAAYVWYIKTLGDTPDGAVAIDMGMAYDPNTHRVYQPQYSDVWVDDAYDVHASDLWGYQLRAVSGKGPKYLNVKKDQDSNGVSFLRYPNAKGDPYDKSVIVEDMLSGIAIIVASIQAKKSVEVLVNYGLGIKLEPLVNLSGKDIYVWLDNDSAHVDDRAKIFKRTIEMLHPFRNVSIITDCHDPKGVDDADIVDRIHGDL